MCQVHVFTVRLYTVLHTIWPLSACDSLPARSTQNKHDSIFLHACLAHTPLHQSFLDAIVFSASCPQSYMSAVPLNQKAPQWQHVAMASLTDSNNL